jgi:tetratricopeptide (TPR) repeat protein
VNQSREEALDAQASALMKQGISLMNDQSAVADALACFDQALAMRRQLPTADVPLFRYGLAACLLNRADALVRLGGAAHLEDALLAYDEGIAVTCDLELSSDPRFPRRLAVAYQNRGLALAMRGDLDAALGSFEAAATLLEDEASAAIEDRRYMRAAVWMNLANARIAAGRPELDDPAQEAALRAIAAVDGLEADDPGYADIGLRARHVLCRVAANRFSASPEGAAAEDVHGATDAVDEALDLIRRWEQRGEARFRGLAADLFRFGARVYASFQPQFLDEFVADNVDPARSSPDYVDDPAMQAAAQEALSLRR